MAREWKDCKNILCIRPDNIGDLIMTGPALRALKESFGAKVTVLTSSTAAGIAAFMPEIDEVMICDLPWVKTETAGEQETLRMIIDNVKKKEFDAAVIFNVYSQNPLPAVMLAYLADIPLRLAYCRENPYQLLTNWVPDKEPYSQIKHQVQRDLDLAATVGAITSDNSLNLIVNEDIQQQVIDKLWETGIDINRPWLILHPGVSEIKRRYPVDKWASAGKRIVSELGYQLVITGSGTEKKVTEELQRAIGTDSYAAGGLFSLEEFIALIKMAAMVISVNTGTVHIAAALQTPCIVLYAQSNPQHSPWKAPHILLPYSIKDSLQSKNEVIRFVNDTLYHNIVPLPDERQIISAIGELVLK